MKGRTQRPPQEDWRPKAQGGYVGFTALVSVFGDGGIVGDGFRDQTEENEVSFVAAKRVHFSNRPTTLLGFCEPPGLLSARRWFLNSVSGQGHGHSTLLL